MIGVSVRACQIVNEYFDNDKRPYPYDYADL